MWKPGLLTRDLSTGKGLTGSYLWASSQGLDGDSEVIEISASGMGWDLRIRLVPLLVKDRGLS